MPISEIRHVGIGKLRPNPLNVRTHSKKQIATLARLIDQIGFIVPVVADEKLVIQAGHARVEAGKRLGLQSVPVVILSGLTGAERRAYVLADNRVGEAAGWDRAGLATELHQLAPLLAEAGLEIELTGFETPAIDALMRDHIDPEQDPTDDLPELAKEPVSCTGDLWLLDRHRLGCGDAKTEADLRKLMGRDRAAMVFTDPPYNVRIRSVQGRGKIRHPEFFEASGEMSADAYTQFLANCLSLAAKYSFDGSNHYVCSDWRPTSELGAAGKEVYAEQKNLVVWVKTNPGQGSFYRSQHELIFVFKKGKAAHVNNVELGRHGRNRSNVWTYAGVNTFRAGRLDDLAVHPTVKPVALVADAMRDSSRRGDIILDCFSGSGTTILAAERVGRRGYGLEIDPRYVDVAIRRWENCTKRDAILMATGQTFAEVAVARSKPRTK